MKKKYHGEWKCVFDDIEKELGVIWYSSITLPDYKNIDIQSFDESNPLTPYFNQQWEYHLLKYSLNLQVMVVGSGIR